MSTEQLNATQPDPQAVERLATKLTLAFILGLFLFVFVGCRVMLTPSEADRAEARARAERIAATKEYQARALYEAQVADNLARADFE